VSAVNVLDLFILVSSVLMYHVQSWTEAVTGYAIYYVKGIKRPTCLITQTPCPGCPVVKFSRNNILQPVTSHHLKLPFHHLVAPPPGLVHTALFVQFIFGKIITIVATRGQILMLKLYTRCTKIYFGWLVPQTPLG